MIIDNTLVLSDHQAVTADAGSTNVWDTLAVGRPVGWVTDRAPDRGEGVKPVPMLVEVTEAFNNLTSMTVSLQVDDNAAFSSARTVATSEAVLLASLVAGYKFSLFGHLPKGVNERYVRLYYDVTGTAPSTGKIFAAVTGGDQTNAW